MLGKIKLAGWVLVCFIITAAAVSAADAGIEEHIRKTETGFYYTVQKGDTLWDLSEKFADSPWQWPELWHYNPRIANPHWIYPGQKILVYEKEWGEKKKEEKAEKAPEPVFHYDMIDSVGFIRDKAVTPSGTIFSVRDDKTLVSGGDHVYIRHEEGVDLSVGSLYTVYRTSATEESACCIDYEGIAHYITGVVAVTDIEPDYAIASVVKSFRDIHNGDMVIPVIKRSPDIKIKDSVPGMEAKIIQSEEEHVLIGQQRIIFIDKGRAEGIEKGQFYDIYHQKKAKIRKHYHETALKPYKVGRLFVLLTEEDTATGLIIASKKPVNPGDIVRCPK